MGKTKPIIILSIGIIFLIIGIIFAVNSYEENKTVKCFDRFMNEIEGLECKDTQYISQQAGTFLFGGIIITFIGFMMLILEDMFK